MPKKSAGMLLYRKSFTGDIEVLLVHPGGPFWAKKDLNSWSVPKGEFDDDEDAFTAAKREFKEETGFTISGDCISLSAVKQPGGKTVFAWAREMNIDAKAIRSNSFKLEWPPRSGNYKEFPEIDKAAWFSIDEAKMKILTGQIPFLENLGSILKKH